MKKFTVNQLKANEILLDDVALNVQGGDFYFDNKLISFYDDLVKINVVSTKNDMNLLNPRNGDLTKVTDTKEVFIWNGVWIPLQRDEVNTYTVSNMNDLDFLDGIIGDIANVSNENLTTIYDGTGWHTILSGKAGTIDDSSTSTGTTWSSSKIQNELNTHTQDAGNY